MAKKDDWTEENTSPILVSLLPLSREEQPPSLQLLVGPGAPRTYDMTRAEMVIGRAIDADVPIATHDLSRRHAAMRRSAGYQFTIFDLESRNGVYLNGVRVHSAALHDGDNLQLGTLVFIYREGHGKRREGGGS